MTRRKGKTGLIDVKELLQRDDDFLRAALQALAQMGYADRVPNMGGDV